MMAEASVTMSIDSESLRNKITCSICNKQYSSPKTLPCLHSFCLACLVTINENESGMIDLTCPECHKNISSVEKSLVDLPEAFQINRLLSYHKFKQKALGKVTPLCQNCVGSKTSAVAFCINCNKFICDLCKKIHGNWSELKDHKTLKLAELKEVYDNYVPLTVTKQLCEDHKGNECTAFCETCESLVCHECILKTHRDHQCFHSDESIKSHKKGLSEDLDSINGLPGQLHSAINVIDRIMENYSGEGRAVEAQLLVVLEKLEKMVAVKRDEMSGKLTDRLTEKVMLLSEQKHNLEEMMMKINSCISFVSEAVDGNHITEFFMLEKNMKRRITELQKEFSTLDLQPVEEPEIHFSYKEKALDSLDESIRISDGSILHAPGDTFNVGEIICFYISLSSAFYKTKDNPMDEVVAEIESLRDRSVCPAAIAVSSNGFAKLQCSFSERGRYLVRVLLGGKHINGSPHLFYMKPNGAHLQKPIKSFNKLQGPKALAITKSHQLIICEENRHSVSIIGLKNKKTSVIGEYGRDQGNFSHPTGIAIDKDGCIYVADSKNDRIQKLSPEGSFLAEYKETQNSKKLHLPSNVKIGNDGFVYVVDRGNNRVVILTRSLEYVSSFGSAGYGLGSLHDPWDLAFDDNGFIYITDRRQHCIQIFTRNGAFRGKIGSQGQQKGKLNHPMGIAIDSNGKIYVCESGNHRVSIFRVSSEFVDCFSIGLSMVNPCGIAVDDDGFLYVACDETVHVF